MSEQNLRGTREAGSADPRNIAYSGYASEARAQRAPTAVTADSDAARQPATTNERDFAISFAYVSIISREYKAQSGDETLYAMVMVVLGEFGREFGTPFVPIAD